MNYQNYSAEHPEIQASHWFTCIKCDHTYHYLTAANRDANEKEHYAECLPCPEPQRNQDYYCAMDGGF